MKSKTKDMVICGIFAAIMCICSVISLPVGVVPVSLGTFAVMLTSGNLGVKRGLITVIVFILIGAIGLPVFSGFQGGVGTLAAPTGGYIIGYIFMPLIAGITIKTDRKIAAIGIGTLLNIGAVIICYIFGTAQFINLTGFSLQTAIATCVAPFIVFDVIKAVCAATLANAIGKKIM